MEKECITCGNFNAYFTKGYCCYLREDCGKCYLKKQTVLKHSTCEKWKSKSRYRLSVRQGLLIREMEDVLTKLSVIKDFIDERRS